MYTRPSLDRKLLAYSTAAGVALAVAPSANGQTTCSLGPAVQNGPLVYRDVNPDCIISASFPAPNSSTSDLATLDIDGDGVADVRFRHDIALSTTGTTSVFFQNAFASVADAPTARDIVAAVQEYAAALNSGDLVSASQSFAGGGAAGTLERFVLASGDTFNDVGFWPPSTVDKYLGIRFVADANGAATTHYGWIRLDLRTAPSSARYEITVKDLAYNATPDGSISAGAGALPVELISFDVTVDAGTPRLAWATATEENNAGFEVQARRQDERDFRTLGFVDGAGTTNEEQRYRFDAAGLGPGRYAFRLRQVDFDGAFEFTPVAEATISVPGTHLLSAAYPNPFNPTAQFELAVPVEQHVRVALFDAQGRKVRELFAGRLDADQPRVIRIEASGLPSGVYLYRAVGERFVDARTLALAK